MESYGEYLGDEKKRKLYEYLLKISKAPTFGTPVVIRLMRP